MAAGLAERRDDELERLERTSALKTADCVAALDLLIADENVAVLIPQSQIRNIFCGKGKALRHHGGDDAARVEVKTVGIVVRDARAVSR